MRTLTPAHRRALSPLLGNIALSVLDEHLHGPWKPDGMIRPNIDPHAPRLP